MDALTMTRLCAEAMGYPFIVDFEFPPYDSGNRHIAVMNDGDSMSVPYHPLTNDAQAMALDSIILSDGHGYQMTDDRFYRYARSGGKTGFEFRADMTKAENRRRARVECVAKLALSSREVEGG